MYMYRQDSEQEAPEDETPEGKIERERLRRQANNARERFVIYVAYSRVMSEESVVVDLINF